MRGSFEWRFCSAYVYRKSSKPHIAQNERAILYAKLVSVYAYAIIPIGDFYGFNCFWHVFMRVSRCHKLLSCILCSTFFFVIIPTNIEKPVKADTVINYEGEKPSSDCSYRSVEEAYFSTEVKTTNKWSGHSNIEITFKNTGTETIHDWYFTFDFNYKIENPFNCRVIENIDNLYTIGNNDWNQDIQPGKSVTIGFTAVSKDGSSITDMPTFYLLNTETVTLKNGDLKYKYEEYSNWSSGFNGALILTNKTKETIRDWTITFGANRPITHADSSLFTDNSDGTYIITNDGNNQNIAKGQSYRIGIQGGSNDTSKAFELTGFTAIAKKMSLKLTDDKDKNGIADVLEVDFNGSVTITPTEAPTSTPTATSTPSVTATPKATNSPTSKPTATNTSAPAGTSMPTVKPTQTNTPTVKPTVTAKPTVTNTPTVKPANTTTPTATVTPRPTVTSTPTASPTPAVSVTPTNTVTTTPSPTANPTGIPDDIDYEKDTDKDGLPDDLEDYYGTDKNKKDTDGDGVNDLHELILETDPLIKDDNGSKDADNDGLTNARESELGTNPKSRDTDIDGLADGAEVNLYGTDPNKYDTDDDGMSDYFEVYTYDCNPKVKDSDKKREQTLEFYPKANNKLDGVVKVEISGAITGAMSENTKIRDIYGKDLHTSSIEALVGVPVDIETTGEFDEMTIRFYYEEGDYDEDDLMIMWYDEENGEYVEWEDTVWLNDGANYVEIRTNHFSKYMLIDEKVWIETWIRAIYSVKDPELNNVGGGGHFSLSDVESYKNSMLERYGDKDKDGIPDIMETNGMIDNIGHVIFTDPNKADSDEDYLIDGIEMGQMSAMQKIFTRSYYYYNKLTSTIVSGDATWEGYVYFKSTSEADNDDSDGDDAKDGVDKTKNDKNGPINYILVDPGDEYRLITARAYETYFNRYHMKSHAMPLNNSAHFQQFFEYLEYDFERIDGPEKEDLVHCSEIQYSRVDNIIICTHGGINDKGAFIQGHTGNIYANDIASLLVNCSSIEIKTIDLLVCYGGYYDSKTKSVAVELLKATHAEAVYGATTSISFLNIGSGRECFLFNVVLDDGGYYKHYYNDKNQLIRKGHLWIFGVMVRITDKDHVPFNVIDDYPDT